MSHSESAIAGFYDHEQDSTGESRRKREAPDWGGDDLFTGTPRGRRFERPARGEQHQYRAATTSTATETVPARVEARSVARRLDLGTIADVMAPATEQRAPEAPDSPVFDETPIVADVTAPRTDEPASAGRRTVTVTGHPDSRAMRHRPAPTVDQRLIGSRPDRIAAYAVAMGFLLILIAFLTANA
jgi:hypothetical protein